MNKSPTREERIAEIVAEVGLSEFSLHVFANMSGKNNLKISTLFHIVCPNPKIRNLSKEVVQRDAPLLMEQKKQKQSNADGGGGGGGGQEQKRSTTTKKSDDELRKIIVRAREKQLNDKSMQVCGSSTQKKAIPVEQKDYRLMFEFVGWGQTETGFYVFLYYVGPEDKGKDNEELRRHSNWHVVPESHLSLFHKHINNDYTRFLRQTPLDVKEAVRGCKHIQYDVRYILCKWKACSKDVIEKHVKLVSDNIELFEFKDSLSTKHHKQRTKDEMATTLALGNAATTTTHNGSPNREGSTLRDTSSDTTATANTTKRKRKSAIHSSGSKRVRHSYKSDDESGGDMEEEEGTSDIKKSKKSGGGKKRRESGASQGDSAASATANGETPLKRDYRIPLPSCREVLVDEYISLGKFPLGDNRKVCGGFKLDHLVTLFNNHVVREERPPTSYTWEPIQFVKAWFLVTDQSRLRKQTVHSLIKKYNLQFDYTQFENFHAIVNDNPAACDDIKDIHDGFVWACMLFHLFTMSGVLPDHIEAKLATTV